MYLYSVGEKHLSNPCVSCPLISNESVKQNAISENTHFKRPALSYVDSRHSEISIFCDNNQNKNERIVRNIFTKLRSASSEELEALLNMSSESCKLIPDKTNFYSYYSQVLLQKELQNSTTANHKQRNVACLCKPVNEIDRAKEVIVDYNTIKNKSCLCKPRLSIENSVNNNTKPSEKKKEKKQDIQIDEKNNSSEESSNSKEIRVCLPLDPEDFGEKFQEKGLKLVIYGDKKSCDCKCCDVDAAGKASSSYECLACTISKNPQFKNLLAGLVNGDKKKDKRSGFSERLSTRLSSSFPFFKKKHKNIQVLQSCDKCEQTCLLRKSETMVNKACSCTCYSEPISEKNYAPHCTCIKCGKIDLHKVTSVSPACNCGGDETWKMVMQMEGKQNYRQIKQILKEIKDQRQEIRDLNRRYTSLLKLQIGKGSGGHPSDNIKEYFSSARRDQLDNRNDPADHHKVNNIKQLKDAINQSTADQQNRPEKKATADTNTNGKGIIANASELSLLIENNKVSDKNDDIIEKATNSSNIKELTDNEEDSCICLVHKIQNTSQKCGNFWRKLFGKKTKVCLKQCQCRATKPVKKCRNLFEEKVKVRPEKGKPK